MGDLLSNDILNVIFAAVGGFLGWWYRGRGSASAVNDNPLLALVAERLRARLEKRKRQEVEQELDELLLEEMTETTEVK